VIGDDVVVGSNVTIGGRSGHSQLPVIGAGAYIGTGARILGPVCIGQNSVIGANAVVLQDVPANSVAVGIPARIIRENIADGAFR
jgi:serine O-acetyltransferase